MTTDRSIDVAIAGGGPAGAAAALTLRAHAPQLEVALLEAGDYSGTRLGETLPPLARQLLRRLGVVEDFEALAKVGGAREVHGTEIAWGSPTSHDEPYLGHARGVGWHLDRPRFDAMLAATCEARGVEVRRGVRVRDADLDTKAGIDRVVLEGGGRLTCRFLVDSTGRSAPLARRLGARPRVLDRLTAHARFFTGAAGDPRLTVEAFEDGWWYGAGLPGGRFVAVCLSDADLAKKLGLGREEAWNEAFAATGILATRAVGAAPDSGVVIRSAASQVLEPAAGDTWLAAGDAASSFDPLSSQGLTKALRSGIFAAYAIADHLLEQKPDSLERYRRFVADEFAAFEKTRLEVYAGERRWRDRPFWRRRS